MEKQSSTSLGLFGILREALRTSIRNGRLLLFITFILFSSYSAKKLANHIILNPVKKDLESLFMLLPRNGSTVTVSADHTLYKAILQDVRLFLTYEFLILSFLCLVLMFAVAASVHSTYEAYTAKVLTLKGVLLGTRGRWKRALTTSLLMILISLASAALLFFVVGVIGVMAEGSGFRALTWTMVVFVFACCYAVYICCLWMLSLVVSIMEENLSGLKAITEAHELMKGKKMKGFLLMLLMMVAGYAISRAFHFLATAMPVTENTKVCSMAVGLAIGVPKVLVYCVWKVFVFVVFTLFYHELKQRKFEEENGTLYAPVAAVAEF